MYYERTIRNRNCLDDVAAIYNICKADLNRLKLSYVNELDRLLRKNG